MRRFVLMAASRSIEKEKAGVVQREKSIRSLWFLQAKTCCASPRSVMCGSARRGTVSRGAVEQAAQARTPMVVAARRLLGELIRWIDNSQNLYCPSLSYSIVHRMKHN
jgi:hypothetical protein